MSGLSLRAPVSALGLLFQKSTTLLFGENDPQGPVWRLAVPGTAGYLCR